MTVIWKVMIILTIVVAFTSNVFAIKCFSCQSYFDPNCEDPFDDSSFALMDCDVGNGRYPYSPTDIPTKCYKIKQKVYGQMHYTRGCALPIHTEDSEISTCNDKDGCNSSYKITQTPLMLTLLIGFSCLLKSWY